MMSDANFSWSSNSLRSSNSVRLYTVFHKKVASLHFGNQIKKGRSVLKYSCSDTVLLIFSHVEAKKFRSKTPGSVKSSFC